MILQQWKINIIKMRKEGLICMKKQILSGIWRMREAGCGQDYPAVVPGSVLRTLLDAGAIEDPYYRDNEYRTRDLFWKDYEFFRNFTVSAELLDYEKLELVCYGLDTLAEVYVNGSLIASTANMHRTYRFPVKDHVRVGENEIRILFRSPLRAIENYRPEEGKEISVVTAGCMKGNQYLRKAHSMFGWDWGPQLPDAGIWRDVELVAYREARIADVRIRQKHEEGSVTVQVDVALEVLEQKTYKVSLTLSPSYFNGQKLPMTETLAKTAIVMQGSDRLTTEIKVEKPRLWWPNGSGDQNLYRLHVSVKPAGVMAGGAAAVQITQIEPIDEKEYTIGLRTLTVSQEEDAWGRGFCFQVNGVKLFSRGADYIPQDCVYSRITDERTDALLSAAKRSNFNTIRVWGGGYYPSDLFYELCDRYGLIVWQDLMFACNAYDLTEAFEENIAAEIKDHAVRLRHHASLGLWCGNNELESAWCYWGEYQQEPPRVRADYIKMFEYLLPKTLREADDTTFYWPSSPSSGGCMDDPDSENRGDCHYWAVWHGQLPFSDYTNHFFRFCSEFGFQSFPNYKTVESYTLPEDRNIFSHVMESHQKNASANGKLLYYISENFRCPKDFHSMLYVTQILQAMAIKSGVEHWRRNRGRCMGTLYWQLNDNWPVASWSGIDYYGRWKPLQYAAKRFYAPAAGSIVRTADAEGSFTGVEAHYQNESRDAVQVELTLSLKTMRFEVLKTITAERTVEPFTALLLAKEDYAALLAQDVRISRPPERVLPKEGRYARGDVFVEAVFRVTDAHGGVTRQYEQEVLLPYKYMELQKAEVRADVSETEDGKAYAITLAADVYTPFIVLDFDDADVIFSDNCISITDREPRTILLKKEDVMSGSFADAADVRSRLRMTCLRDTYNGYFS